MSRSLLLRLSTAALAAAFLVVCSRAHEGPEHEVEELTELIKVQGHSADLLVQRAVEYKVLGKFTEAARDLERALELDAQSVTAQRELSQTYFSLGKTNEALATVTAALRQSASPEQTASLLVARAGILRARRDYAKALADTTEAIDKYPQDVEWFLLRSQLQALLNRRQERVKGLEEGLQQTGSGLLLAELVDALTDNGQYALAAEKIGPELAQSRWRAAWLIRRAKVSLATGKPQDAKTDLTTSLDELNRRLGSTATDAQLLAERGMVYDLLGKNEEARRDYRAARTKGFADEWLRDRIRALAPEDKDEE